VIRVDALSYGDAFAERGLGLDESPEFQKADAALLEGTETRKGLGGSMARRGTRNVQIAVTEG